MQFSTDTAWPDGLLLIFQLCENNSTFEDRYWGPCNKLFTYCFGGEDSSDFFISIHIVNSIDSFIIFDGLRRPMLVFQIRDDAWVAKADLRSKADAQMRQLYKSVLRDSPIPRLWGLSLLGTSLRVYSGDVDTGRVAPASEVGGGWNVDILSQGGFDKMQEIVRDIVIMKQ